MRRLIALALLVAPLAVAGDDPRISRSAGAPDALVVLWPRVIPATEDPAVLAVGDRIQDALVRSAQAALPGRALDRRPQPERVCPRAGCQGPSVGATLLHRSGGCAAVATFAGPGVSPMTPVAWAGAVRLKQPLLAFRAPVESYLTVVDFARCEDLPGLLEEARAPIDAAMGALFPG